MTDDMEDLPLQADRTAAGVGLLLALAVAGTAAAMLAVLVLATDPTPQQVKVFVVLSCAIASGLGAAALLVFGGRTDNPVRDTLRAYRRGLLVGLACAGVIVLQLNQALSPANVAFVLLILLIFEMIFLARRQDSAP
jgi:hypothetical protein